MPVPPAPAAASHWRASSAIGGHAGGLPAPLGGRLGRLLVEAAAAPREARQGDGLLRQELRAGGDHRVRGVEQQRAQQRRLRPGPGHEQVAQALQRVDEEVLDDSHPEAWRAEVDRLAHWRLEAQPRALVSTPAGVDKDALHLVEGAASVQDGDALSLVAEVRPIILQEVEEVVAEAGRPIMLRVLPRRMALQEVQHDVA
mmetsp:Transcript_73351/g.203333  ORF Transcript_73351/g.203333 Transcript_73351/m.203333 type:complete len:200 (-) Transcript_73351:506-1105(-)